MGSTMYNTITVEFTAGEDRLYLTRKIFLATHPPLSKVILISGFTMHIIAPAPSADGARDVSTECSLYLENAHTRRYSSRAKCDGS